MSRWFETAEEKLRRLMPDAFARMDAFRAAGEPKTIDDMLEIAEAPEKAAKVAADEARIAELQAEIRGLEASCDQARNYADQNKPEEEVQKILDHASRIRTELLETNQDILCQSRNAALLIAKDAGVSLHGFNCGKGSLFTFQDAIARPADYLAALGGALDKLPTAAGGAPAADLYAKLQAEKNPMAKALFYRDNRLALQALRPDGSLNEETTEGDE